MTSKAVHFNLYIYMLIISSRDVLEHPEKAIIGRQFQNNTVVSR